MYTLPLLEHLQSVDWSSFWQVEHCIFVFLLLLKTQSNRNKQTTHNAKTLSNYVKITGYDLNI